MPKKSKEFLNVIEILDRLEVEEDDDFEDVGMVAVNLLPPDPRKDAEESAGDSDNSDTPLGNINRLSKGMMEARAEYQLYSKGMDIMEQSDEEEDEEVEKEKEETSPTLTPRESSSEEEAEDADKAEGADKEEVEEPKKKRLRQHPPPHHSDGESSSSPSYSSPSSYSYSSSAESLSPQPGPSRQQCSSAVQSPDSSTGVYHHPSQHRHYLPPPHPPHPSHPFHPFILLILRKRRIG
jgi:hypothetical protein